MSGGKVIDIRTGRAIAKTRDLSETFTRYMESLFEKDVQFYIVHGRCRHDDVRNMVTSFRQMPFLQVIYDAKMPSDTVWIFEGDPAELGFAV